MGIGVLKLSLVVLGAKHLWLAYTAYTQPSQWLDLLHIKHGAAVEEPLVTVLHVVAAAHLALAVLNLLSFFMGSAARVKVAVSNLVFLSAVAADGSFFNRDNITATQSAVVGPAAVLVVGLVLHAFEPGLLTADKTKAKAK